MNLDQMITESIEKLVEEIRRENGIINRIIRDDVFSILQECDCTVLYFPLPNENSDGCSGCHLEKNVNGKFKQFVFINTANTRERQAFSAAHELGHIWRVDERIREMHPDKEIDTEDVVNQFAAELLMPRKYFESVIDGYLEKESYSGPSMTVPKMVKLIAYLMNYFFVPYKAVVYRFNEIERLHPKFNSILFLFKESSLLDEIIKAEQFTRLGIVNNLKSMDNLPEFLVEAEKDSLFNPEKVKNIRDDFDIQAIEDDIDETKVVF